MKLHPEAKLPTRAHPDDAGLDLYALEDQTLAAGSGTMIRTGIALALPPMTVGLVADRSSMAKRGLKTAGGVIDAGYRGEIQIVMRNLTPEPIAIARGEKVAQMLILPILTPMPVEAESLDETSRGDRGFGSTGR